MGGKVYLGSQFKKFQFMVGTNHEHGSNAVMAWWKSLPWRRTVLTMAGRLREKGGAEEDICPSKSCPQ